MTTAAEGRFRPGCLAAGLLCLAVGAGMLLWGWRGASGAATVHWPGLAEIFGRGYSRAEGVVIRSEGVSMPASRGGVYPVVRFEAGGKTYEFKGAAQDSEYVTPGERVSVAYKSADPTVAHVRGIRQTIPAFMLSGGGLLLFVAGILSIWFALDSLRRRPREASAS